MNQNEYPVGKRTTSLGLRTTMGSNSQKTHTVTCKVVVASG